MKKTIFRLCLTFVLLFALTGCGSKNAEDKSANTMAPDPTTENPVSSPDHTPSDNQTDMPSGGRGRDAALNGTIVITGSTSVDKILNDMIDEYSASNPDVDITYTGSGSSAGIQDTIDGINTLGAASRELKEEEKAAGVKAEVFAYDGIAVAVNPANEVSDLTMEDLAKIYSGQITNWSELGGKDAPIVVVSREGASGTRSAFEELVKLEDAGGLTDDAMVVEGNGNVQSTVAGNENAIGYVSFSFVDDTVKPLTVAGIEANADNAKSGSYPLSRPFLLVYMDSKLDELAKSFIEFAKSSDGQAFVEEHGGIKID